MLSRFKPAGAIVAIAIAIFAPALPSGARPAPPVLVDQSGHAFTFATLARTPLVVTFVAAHCTDACPLVNAEFSAAARIFLAERRRIHLLTITLDPEHDSPADMRLLAKAFGADPRTWTLASGKVADVHRVMRAFGVVARQGRKGYADVHTTFVYFIDARGSLRRTLLASADLTDQVVAEVHANWQQLTQ